jgi:GST-like protein
VGQNRSLLSEASRRRTVGNKRKSDYADPGGKPYTHFESGAILLYLAEKTGQFLPKDPVAKFDAIQWMMVQMTLVGPMFGQYVHFTRFAPKGNDYSLDRYRTQVRRVLATVEERLGVVPFLSGQSYSIADIATFPWARGVGTFLGKPAEADYPKLMAWVGTINSRPAVTRALAAVDELRAKTTAFDNAGEGAKDRLFGRGHYAA